MMHLKVIVLASAIFAYCESAAVLAKLGKCSISDDECVRGLYRNLINEIADNGIPEMGVPKADPLTIKDQSFVALGFFKLTMKEGEAKGLKNCYATSFKSDLATQRHAIDFVCDRYVLEGSYKIESTPTLLNLLGGIDIHGEGTGGIVLEQVYLSLDFAFEVKKLDDGELHIQIIPDDCSYTLEVKGKATIHADNILVGKEEISTVLVKIFNENWNFIVNHFGKTIVDSAINIFYEQAQIFLSKVPAKDFINEDLSSYVKS